MWSGQNIYLYPYLADKNDVDQFKKFSRNLELKRSVYKLFTGLHCHLTPHLSSCEPPQLVLVDKKIKFCQSTLWFLTIMLLYFGLSLLLFPLMSAFVPCLQLIWTEYHNHWGKIHEDKKIQSYHCPPVWALPPHCTSADALAAEQLHVIRQTVVLSATTLPEKAVKYFSRTKIFHVELNPVELILIITGAKLHVIWLAVWSTSRESFHPWRAQRNQDVAGFFPIFSERLKRTFSNTTK